MIFEFDDDFLQAILEGAKKEDLAKKIYENQKGRESEHKEDTKDPPKEAKKED